jgi:uncharacterized protein (TIGR02466 family)
MEGKVYEIFPIPIMKFKLDRKFTKKEFEFFKEKELDCHNNFGNKSSNNTYILNEIEMIDINKFCKDALFEYFNKVYNPFGNVNLKITQSWLNYTIKDGYHHTHSHPNSMVSGVLYINTDNDSNVITFARNNYKQIDITPKALNDYNSDEIDFKANVGELILFPSSLTHRVPKINSLNTRISLAFNSFVEGEIGYIKSLNYLKI